MAFDEAPILDVSLSQSGTDVHLSWRTASAGPFQVYADRRLQWSGYSTYCTIPRPPTQANIHVGEVDAAEIDEDLSSTLADPPGTGDRVTLTWQGGTYLADDLAVFNVYSSAAPGGAISYTAPVAVVSAFVGGIALDGFGLGGFGSGGFGQSASDYSWTSGRLKAGTWMWEVRPADEVGNERTGGPTASITIAGPPGPPARDGSGSRLTYTYNATTHVVTLAWLASPG